MKGWNFFTIFWVSLYIHTQWQCHIDNGDLISLSFFFGGVKSGGFGNHKKLMDDDERLKPNNFIIKIIFYSINYLSRETTRTNLGLNISVAVFA